MSLIGFHRFLITTAILFCGAFAAWQLRHFSRGGTWLNLVLTVVFGLATLGLAFYLARLDDFLGRGEGG